MQFSHALLEIVLVVVFISSGWLHPAEASISFETFEIDFGHVWYNEEGVRGPANTFTGVSNRYEPTSQPYVDFNSTFGFDLNDFSGGANFGLLRLRLDLFISEDSSESFTLFDYSSAPPISTEPGGLFGGSPPALADRLAIYADLQSGSVYGSGSVSSSDVGRIIDIPLTASAIADANSASGGHFAIGISLDTLDRLNATEGIRFGLDRQKLAVLILSDSPIDPTKFSSPSLPALPSDPETPPTNSIPERNSVVVWSLLSVLGASKLQRRSRQYAPSISLALEKPKVQLTGSVN